MFTVNIKGRRNPHDLGMAKLDIVFYKTGYSRVTKVLCVTGPFENWNQKEQAFAGDASKNKLLLKEKLKYIKVAEKWESENKDWLPTELPHCFDKRRPVNNDRHMTVVKMLDYVSNQFHQRERIKNGKVFISDPTAKNYIVLKKVLSKFTRNVYRKEFSTYKFGDIDERFLLEFVSYQQKRGAKNTLGGVTKKLKLIHALFAMAKRKGILNIDMTIFTPVKSKLKDRLGLPKTLSTTTIKQIEQTGRGKLTDKEEFYLDLFLFSYYAGGMSAIDVCFLNRNCINGNLIIYERIKCDQLARVVLLDKARAIIEKYGECDPEYVFPIFTKKHTTQKKMYGRVKRTNYLVNQTLRKICDEADIKDKVTWGSARASFISRLIDEGYHPLQIAEQVGNSPNTIYKYYYSHTDKETLRQNMNRIF